MLGITPDAVSQPQLIADLREKAAGHALPEDDIQQVELKAGGMNDGKSGQGQAELGLLGIALFNEDAACDLLPVRSEAGARPVFPPSLHRLTNGRGDLIMINGPGNGQDGVIRLIAPRKIAEHHLPGDIRNGVASAGDIASQRLPRPEELVYQHGDTRRRGIQRHVYLLDNDLTLFFNFRGVEQRIKEDIHQHVQRGREMRLGDLAPVHGQFLVRAGVQDTPYPFHDGTDIGGGRALFRTFEQHVLDEVGDTGVLIILVAGACPDKKAYGYRAGMGHNGGKQAQAVIQR